MTNRCNNEAPVEGYRLVRTSKDNLLKLIAGPQVLVNPFWPNSAGLPREQLWRLVNSTPSNIPEVSRHRALDRKVPREVQPRELQSSR